MHNKTRAGNLGGALEVEDSKALADLPVGEGGEGEGWDLAPGFFDGVGVLVAADGDFRRWGRLGMDERISRVFASISLTSSWNFSTSAFRTRPASTSTPTGSDNTGGFHLQYLGTGHFPFVPQPIDDLDRFGVGGVFLFGSLGLPGHFGEPVYLPF